MLIAVDTETTGLSPYLGDRLFAIGICYVNFINHDLECTPEYFSWPVDPKTRNVNISYLDEKYRNIKELLIDPSVTKVFHNAKFDIGMLAAAEINVKGQIHDTMIAARVCNTLEPTVGLKALAHKYLNIDMTDEVELKAAVRKARIQADKLGFLITKDKKDNISPDYWLCPDLCKIYCQKDTIRTLKLWQFYQEAMLPQNLNVRHTYDKEIKLLPILYNMEKNRSISKSY